MNEKANEERRERLAVIDNEARAIEAGNLFAKVELHDPIVTKEDREKHIVVYNPLHLSLFDRIRHATARKIGDTVAEKKKASIHFAGLEHLVEITGGAVVTSNHFNPLDSLPVRLLGRSFPERKRVYTAVQESNYLMRGFFGFLMRNCDTIPFSASPLYMAKIIRPAIKEILMQGDLLLVYPEQEMWWNYRKPRDFRDGAYHIAAENGVPILSCFSCLTNTDRKGESGFFEVETTFAILPPIFPDPALSVRENRERMREIDLKQKRDCYRAFYGREPDSPFDPTADIAGYAE